LLSRGVEHLSQVELVFTDERCGPFAMVGKIIFKLGLVKLLVALGWLSADRSHFLGFTFFVFTNLFGFCNEKLRKGACNVLVLNKKGSPVVPVAGVPVLGVQALAVVVCLISDIENAIHQLGTQFSALLFLKLLFVAF